MCKWIRRLVSFSPLEYLEIVCDDRDQFYGGGPNISYDGLVDHLILKHSKTLRSLCMKDAYIGDSQLERLLEECHSLDTLTVSISPTLYVRLILSQPRRVFN